MKMMKTLIPLFLLLLGEKKHAHADPCVDSSIFTLTAIRNGNEVRRACSWIKEKEDRKAKFCHKTFNSTVVRDACPLSCEACNLGRVASSCNDSTTYTFSTRSKGITVQRKCKWLSTLKFRQDKFCDRNSNGSMIKDECRISCNNCLIARDDTEPLPSLPAHLTCENSATFEFITYSGGRPEFRNCNWLGRNPDRARKFCRSSYLSGSVRNACMIACDNCPSSQPSSGPTDLPTSMPSMTHTSSPSYEPSIHPTTVPTSAPSIEPCLDSTTYRFESTSNGKVVLRPCYWLSVREDVEAFRVAKFCPKLSNGTYVKDECILSCGNCPTESPSSLPSVSFSTTPSAKPTILASTSPSELPTTEPEPSSEPSGVSSEEPSMSPTAEPSQSLSTPPSLVSSVTPSETPISSATTSSELTEAPTEQPSLGT